MRKNSGSILVIIVIIIGVALLLGGVKLQENIDEFMEKAVETVGVVKYVEKEIVKDKDVSTGEIKYETKYHVHITYTDKEGNEYPKIIETSSSSYYKGDEVTVYYDPKEPSYSKTKSDAKSGKIMSIFGVGVLIVSAVIIISDIKQKRRDGGNNIQTTDF